MLRHVVLLQLRADAHPDAVHALVDALRALPAHIDAIDEYEVGTDAGLADDNAAVAVVAAFADAEGWRTYQDHPAHQEVLTEHVRPLVADRAAIQFEG